MQGIVITVEQLSLWVDDFLLILTRVAAMLSIVPVMGSRLVPLRIKVLISVVISLSVFSVIPVVPEYELYSFEGLLIVLYQILIGLGMGFILQMVFNAITLAGETIAMTMGLGFAQMVDPQNGVNVPVVSQFYIIISVLLFLSLNIHEAIIRAVVESFYSLPIEPFSFDLNFVWRLLEWAKNMYINAVLIGLPIITGLLIVNITMGVMTRAAPQLNIFAVGFPITMLVGFLLVLLSMTAFLPKFEILMEQAFQDIGFLVESR